MPEFKKLTDFPRGTIYDILCDAYSYDGRNESVWDNNWKETDASFTIILKSQISMCSVLIRMIVSDINENLQLCAADFYFSSHYMSFVYWEDAEKWKSVLELSF